MCPISFYFRTWPVFNTCICGYKYIYGWSDRDYSTGLTGVRDSESLLLFSFAWNWIESTDHDTFLLTFLWIDESVEMPAIGYLRAKSWIKSLSWMKPIPKNETSMEEINNLNEFFFFLHVANEIGNILPERHMPINSNPNIRRNGEISF